MFHSSSASFSSSRVLEVFKIFNNKKIQILIYCRINLVLWFRSLQRRTLRTVFRAPILQHPGISLFPHFCRLCTQVEFFFFFSVIINNAIIKLVLVLIDKVLNIIIYWNIQSKNSDEKYSHHFFLILEALIFSSTPKSKILLLTPNCELLWNNSLQGILILTSPRELP